MNTDTTEVLPVLLSQADEEVRMALRPLLKAALRYPGELYNPIYVGPLRSASALRREVAASLDEIAGRSSESASKLPVMLDADQAEGVAISGPAVVVASGSEATLLLRGEVGLGAQTQLIVWGEASASELSPFLQECLVEGGFSFDPGEHCGLFDGWSMGSVLLRAIENRFTEANPTVVAAPQASASMLVSEAHLRLEIAGCDPVEVYPPNELPEESVWQRWPQGAAVILRCDRLADEARRVATLETVVALVGRGVLVVMVVGTATLAEIEADPAWHLLAARAGVVRAVEDSGDDPVQWPDPAAVLLGAPRRVQEVAHTLSFHLDSVPLDELLQLAAVWGRSGHFVLYNEHWMGWIEVEGDVVVGATRLGDSDEPVGQGVIMARIRSMSEWGSGQVVFVPGIEAGRRDGVPLSMIVFDLARAVDERRAGRAPDRDERVPELTPRRAHQIAEALVAWGLSTAAVALLQHAERLSEWGAEEDLLLAHLCAEWDPQAAVSRLRHGVFRLASEDRGSAARSGLQIDATLNALLLEVRGAQVRPSAAWAMVERWLAAGGEDWVRTERHAAILFELATRARRDDAAERFWLLLLERVGWDHPLVQSLSTHRHSERAAV